MFKNGWQQATILSLFEVFNYFKSKVVNGSEVLLVCNIHNSSDCVYFENLKETGKPKKQSSPRFVFPIGFSLYLTLFPQQLSQSRSLFI